MGTQPRSLAQDLRQRDDDELVELLQLRPDLASPPPSDLGQLAARSHTAGSTTRALDRLDAFTLQVLDVVVVLPEPVAEVAVAPLLPGAMAEQVHQALIRLRALGLLWGEPDAYRPTSTVREALGSTPAGLGPWLADLRPGSAPLTASVIDELLRAAPPDALAALQHLAWGPPFGAIDRADRQVTPDDVTTPVDWLLAHGLLAATDQATVALPREVGLHLRGDRVHAEVMPTLPAAETTAHDPAAVDRAAAGSAFEAVRRVEDLLESWSVEPPAQLRAGGLGVRELRAAATAMDVDEATAALLVETAHDAGLLAPADDGWLPTPAYDQWQAQPLADRWVVLATAWLDSTRTTGLVGSRDAKGGRINVLGPDLDRVVQPEIRRAVLVDLAAAGPGTAIDAAELCRRQAWRRPRRGRQARAALVRWSLAEGGTLGLLAHGALAGPARQLLDGSRSDAADALDPLLPTPLRHVLLQADLTAVAPGPLDGDVARELALAADVESTGGATVYRFSPTSVRRALDAGRSGTDVLAFLAAHSRTPVPQPLEYLIEDVARRHGRLRVGSASSYLRCDDPAVLDELLADRRSQGLRLRRLAPTVAGSMVPPEALLDQVRQMGLLPAAETAEGALVVRRPDVLRSPPHPRPPRLVTDPPVPAAAGLRAAVRAMRVREQADQTSDRDLPAVARSGPLPRTAVADTLQLLADAAVAGRAVLIGYVGTDGLTTSRVVDPVEVRGGWLTAYDQQLEQMRAFAVHRITGATRLAPDRA